MSKIRIGLLGGTKETLEIGNLAAPDADVKGYGASWFFTQGASTHRWLEASSVATFLTFPNDASLTGFELTQDPIKVHIAGTEVANFTATHFRTFGLDFDLNDKKIAEVKSITYKEVALGNTGAALNIDLTTGSVFTMTVNGDCAFTFTDPAAPGVFYLYMTNDGSVRTPTFPADVLAHKGLLTHDKTANAKNAHKLTFYGTKGYVIEAEGASLAQAVQTNP